MSSVAHCISPSMESVPIRSDATAIWGHFKSEIGLGSAARGYAAALSRTSLVSSCHDVPLPGRASVQFECDPMLWRAGTNLYVQNPPELLAGGFLPHSALRDTKRIGIWAWELSHFPEQWKPAIDLVDEIWVGSLFIANAVHEVTHKPVRILQCPIVRRNYARTADARARILPSIDSHSFVFLTAFDFGSYITRKNPMATLAAFLEAFPVNLSSRPYLVIKCHGDVANITASRALATQVSHWDRVFLINQVLSPRQMADLQDACDCFISLHRSEGFGFNIAEMMRGGKPVICTGYSGNLDFTDSENSFLVDYTLVPVREGEYLDHVGQVWAAADHGAAVRALREVHYNQNTAMHRARLGRETILRQYSIETVAEKILQVLASGVEDES